MVLVNHKEGFIVPYRCHPPGANELVDCRTLIEFVLSDRHSMPHGCGLCRAKPEAATTYLGESEVISWAESEVRVRVQSFASPDCSRGPGIDSAQTTLRFQGRPILCSPTSSSRYSCTAVFGTHMPVDGVAVFPLREGGFGKRKRPETRCEIVESLQSCVGADSRSW